MNYAKLTYPFIINTKLLFLYPIWLGYGLENELPHYAYLVYRLSTSRFSRNLMKSTIIVHLLYD